MSWTSDVYKVRCPYCGARVGAYCSDHKNNRRFAPHTARRDQATKQKEN